MPFWKNLVLCLPLLLGLWGCATQPQPKLSPLPLSDTPLPVSSWRPATNTLLGPVTLPEPIPAPVATNAGHGNISLPPAYGVSNPFTNLLNPWIPLEKWSLANGLGRPRPANPQARHSYVIGTTNGTLALTVGSRLAKWEGLDCWLGFAPQLAADGQPLIHHLDGQKCLLPLQTPFNGAARVNPVIVIDPGHGGKSVGARNIANGRYEKDYTLDWGLRLGKILARQGWTVVLTRTNDCDITLEQRLQIAEQHQAGLFISLHFNSASPSWEQSGLETYCLTPTGMPSSVTRDFEDDTRQVFPNNAFDFQNLQLAMRLHRALLKSTGTQDRGVRRARFMSVLRGQTRPAVLIEGGYLSNPREARLIADSAYRQNLAEAAARALDFPALRIAQTPPPSANE